MKLSHYQKSKNERRKSSAPWRSCCTECGTLSTHRLVCGVSGLSDRDGNRGALFVLFQDESDLSMSRSGGEGVAREGKAESTGEAAAGWTRAGLSPPLRLSRSLAGRGEERPAGGTSSMKWGPRHLLRASEGILQRNLKS